MLVLLVGPKGSGKSHIGRVLERELGIRFFHVEPLWAELNGGDVARGETRSIEDGIRVVHPRIEAALEQGHVTVETTGGSPEILNDLLRIGETYGICLVRVSVPLDLCMKRIRERDPSGQIPVADEVILEIHRRFEALSLPWDLDLENVELSDEAIKAALEDLVVGGPAAGQNPTRERERARTRARLLTFADRAIARQNPGRGAGPGTFTEKTLNVRR